MYAFIRGVLMQAQPHEMVIETHGVGYRLNTPASVYQQFNAIGSEIILYTSFVVRENSQALYGFTSLQERDLFEILLEISGIGPKTALNIISHLPMADLHHAVSNKDITTLSKVPGIGKKTAERLIIEMRDKIPSFPMEHSIQVSDPVSQKIQDAMSALINLGYNQQSAQKAIKKTLKELSEEAELSLLITTALKNV